MKKLLLLVAIWVWFSNKASAQNIVAGEYFWNTDPGVGLGTALTPSEISGGIGDETFNLNVGGPLTAGQHILFVRFKLNDTLWSQAEGQPILISPENHLAGATDQVDSLEMKEIEYYWNLESNPHATIWLPSSDDAFNFTLNFPTAGADKGGNQLFFRFKDKYGFYTPWQSESILVMGRQSGELAKVDSIRYALSGYSYMGTPPNDFLNVTFNVADTLKRDSYDSDVIGSKEITTIGLTHGVHVMTFKVFGSTLLDSSIVSSKNSHFYQTVVRVDTTIKMQIGEPRLANNTLSTEFCPGGIIKIPIDTTGNWPRNNPALISAFTIKLSNSLGQNFVGITSTMNTTGDTLVGTIPNDVAIASGYKVMVESTLPMIRDTAAASLTIGLTLTPFATNAVLCEAETLNMGVNSNVPATYSWTGPAGFTATGNAPTRANIPASGGGTYTVNATSTLAGCTSSASLAITVNPLPVITLGSNSPVCEGQNINLTSSAIGNAFMAWAKGNVNIGGISGNKTVSAATLADSGYYKVAYMSIPGCIKTDSIKVIVKPLPILSGISTNSPICSGNTLTFGLNASPGSTYSWSGPNSFTSVLEDPNISSAATNASGTYSVTVSLNGCSVNTTVVNVVNLTPTVSTTSPVAICQGAALTLNVNNTPTATYGWSGPSGFSSIIEDPLVSNTATVGMNGTYSVTVSLGSCSANGTIAVTVNPNPVLLITNQNTTGSGPVNITVPAATAGSTLPPSSSLSYFTNSLATNVLASPTEVAISGTYYIKATSPAGCVDVKPIVVNICGSTFNLVSPTDDYNSELQVKTSTVKITASNKITGTANITYRSAQAIELNPGFLAANGTVFLAEKGICN
jgi:hypothetical protein